MAKTDVFTLRGLAGVKRDGTNIDNEYYQDALWCRFQRGRPRKMGGYRAMSTVLYAPIRNVFVDARALVNTAHCFSQYGVEQLTFDPLTGAGSNIAVRTPSGFTANANYTWQSDSMWDNTGGNTAALLACCTPDLSNIADDTTGALYTGNIQASAALTAVSDGDGPIAVSGGMVVLQPFVFVYGQMGLIRNSNANDFSAATGWSGNQANTGNFAGTKIVKGLPIRGGSSSPAGLFWALDSLILVSYIGGTALWSYSPQSGGTTVLSKSAIVEYDGIYYWPGLDRFFAYTGVVQELPNQMNANYFFDNLNRAQAQKVWVQKVPRFGEIWWHYPSGGATECNNAIIYNVREKTWYDTAVTRASGASPRVFSFPVSADSNTTPAVVLTFNTFSLPVRVGDIATGSTSGATGTVVKVVGLQATLTGVTGTFTGSENVNTPSGGGGTTNAVSYGAVGTLWQHETGTDQIVGTNITAIDSYFETNNFGWATGGPVQDAGMGATNSTRITQFEPDFISSGPLSVTVRGTKYAQSPASEDSIPFAIDSTVERADMREQRRTMSLKVESNVVGGYYEMGRPLMTLEPGDERAA